ncbi:TorF family putative porin [Luteimonas sp. BDR2-5]|uniref:TorF family putative porin n=1 Tax=Proluteimonas luteida TaxID=2878685 RepID=UPI001E5A2924|nr:TorF family putative porin [Luteimonas sp. BDR2-5]MCD9027965.1 TorF family putative porin [Luteimonas sp. BDR2-5]
MSSRKHASATLLFLCLVSAGAAHAEVSGSITLTSDYLFRGVTQTDEKPALQGGIEWAHDSGFYVGTWGSSISWLADSDPDVSSQLELDGYLGWRGEFGDSGFGYDVGAVRYWYPGSYPAGFDKADTTELYVGVSWNILSATYSYAVTDLFGIPDSDGSSNLDLGVGWEFAPGWTLDGAVGKQWVSGSGGTASYAFWSLGVGKSFDNGFGLALAWNDNDIDGLDDTINFAVTKSF